MSLRFSLTGSDLAATLRRISEDAVKRAAAKRLAEQQHQTQERSHEQPGQ